MKLYIISGNQIEVYESIVGETIDQLQKNLGSEVIFNNRKIENTSMLVNSFFNDGDNIKVEKIKPQVVQTSNNNTINNIKPIHYNNITKFSFYELDEMNVRIIIELKDIAKVPLDQFTARFFDKSFDLKIHNYLGQNWTFGVSRTQCKMDSKNCKFTLKGDKILITIRKIKKDDNWFSISKQKTIGGEDSD